MMDPGSDFRLNEILQPLFCHHEHWSKMTSIILEGVSYPLSTTTEAEHKADIIHMISRGNHKSATTPQNEPTLLKNYNKQVDKVWMLPITIESVSKIKGAGVIPIGYATKFSINEDGNRYTKRTTTRNASFPPTSGNSVNERIIRDLFTECFYGHFLLRFLHAIHIMRWKHPILRIFITKIDLEAAYFQLYVVTAMAVLIITILKNVAYILLRLPFGVANGPNDFILVSEIIMDLTNNILGNDS